LATAAVFSARPTVFIVSIILVNNAAALKNASAAA